MPFMLFHLVPATQVATLDATKQGNLGSGNIVAQDVSNGDYYVKTSTGWVKTVNGGANPSSAAIPVTGAIAVKNSAGTVTRNLTATAGVVNLAATDAIVANNDSLVLKKSDGTTTSSGNAGLNSPASAVVAAGVVTNIKAGA
jgi:hypothetical protein